MRWLSFAPLACIAICVQTALVPKMDILGVRPEVVLIILVHYALHARTSDGLIACWLFGLLMDLTSVERLGVVALVYALIGLAIWSIRDVVFSKHPLTHLTITFVAVLIAQIVLRVFFSARYGLPSSLLSVSLASCGSALYSGILAVLIHGLLVRLERLLGFREFRQPFTPHAR